MNRVSVFVRRQRIQKLDKWIMRAILIECFFTAIFPSVAAAGVLIGIVAWFLRLQIDTKYKLRGLPLDVPAGLFVFISLISVFNSSVRSLELIGHFVAFVGLYSLTYVLIGQNIRTRLQVRNALIALSLSALIVVLYGYSQYIFGIDTVDMKWVDPEKFPELKNRVFSTLENPNVLAGYLDIFICIALGILTKVNGKVPKLLMLIAILMLSACLAMTYSRGAYITIAIVFIVYGVFQDWRVLLLFIIASIGIFFYDETFVKRLLSVFELTDSSQGLRVGIWTSTLAMIADHPFIGIGWGAFLKTYPSYNYYIKDAEVLIYHAHNIYLHYAAEIGIIGAMSFFWLFFGTMFNSMDLKDNKKYQSLKEKFDKVLGFDIKSRLLKVKNSIKVKFSTENEKFAKVLDYKNKVNEKMEDASERIMNWISPPKIELDVEKEEEKPKVSLEKEETVDSEVDVSVATVETDTTLASTEIKSELTSEVTEEVATVSSETFKRPIANLYIEPEEKNDKKFDWHEVKTISNQQLAEGFRAGIGLAFLSMALNGLTDDLLFNISTSMLMWLLAAMAGAIENLPEEEPVAVKRRRWKR